MELKIICSNCGEELKIDGIVTSVSGMNYLKITVANFCKCSRESQLTIAKLMNEKASGGLK